MLETGHKTDENTRKEEVAGKTLPEQIRKLSLVWVSKLGKVENL